MRTSSRSTLHGSEPHGDGRPRADLRRERGWFDDPGSRPFWIAEINGETAGWFSFEPFRKKPSYRATSEVSVYVAEEHRRQGVGRRLLAEAIRRAPGSASRL